MSRYCLYYWPQIPGRGEFIRLAFAKANVPLREVNEVPQIQQLTTPENAQPGRPSHLAVPILEEERDGGTVWLSQTPAILGYIAPKLDLDGMQPGVDQAITHSQVLQLALTGLDWANEAHDVHHPMYVACSRRSMLLYYEEQKEAAVQAARVFCDQRIPKYAKVRRLTLTQHFETQIRHNAKTHGVQRLLGTQTSIADLVLYQVVEGLHFAFPNTMKKHYDSLPAICRFREEIHGELRTYVDSPARRPFNDGLFRHYPELDLP